MNGRVPVEAAAEGRGQFARRRDIGIAVQDVARPSNFAPGFSAARQSSGRQRTRAGQNFMPYSSIALADQPAPCRMGRLGQKRILPAPFDRSKNKSRLGPFAAQALCLAVLLALTPCRPFFQREI